MKHHRPIATPLEIRLRRVRWQHGLTGSTAHVVADLAFGEVR